MTTIAESNAATLDARRRIALAIKRTIINSEKRDVDQVAALVATLAEAHSRLWLLVENDEPIVLREDAKGNLESM